MKTHKLIAGCIVALVATAGFATGNTEAPASNATTADDESAALSETDEKVMAEEAEMAKLEAEDEAAAGAETAGGAATPATGNETPAATPPTSNPAGGKAYDFISDGQRITLSDKDITLVPPKGWEVFTTHPSLTLLMQVPHQAGMKYQRTVQIASFSGSKFLDEVTAKEYEQIIVKKFTEVSTSVVDYRIRNHMPIEMADGRQGLLFYSEFQVDGVSLMQAHILVSSTKRHYVMTYTDLAEYFENDDKNQNLTEAWEAMTSIELEGRSPRRFESVFFIAIGATVLVLLGVAGYFVRRIRAGRKFAEYAQGHGLDENEPITREPRSFVSNISSTASDISELKSMREEKLKKGKGKTFKEPETDYNTSNFDDEDIAV